MAETKQQPPPRVPRKKRRMDIPDKPFVPVFAPGKHGDDEKSVHERRRVFVGGLDQHTTEETLRHFFHTMGKVTECVLMRERGTSFSRCFAFVTFEDPAIAKFVVDRPALRIDGKRIRADYAVVVGTDAFMDNLKNPEAPKKLIVRGLNFETKTAAFRHFFEQYGVVNSVQIMRDLNRKSRGFGFVTFSEKRAMEQCLKSSCFLLDGKFLSITLAVPKSQIKRQELDTLPIRPSIKKLIVRRLPDCVKERQIGEHFDRFGPIRTFALLKARTKYGGLATVEYMTEVSAKQALEYEHHRICGTRVQVSLAKNTRKRTLGLLEKIGVEMPAPLKLDKPTDDTLFPKSVPYSGPTGHESITKPLRCPKYKMEPPRKSGRGGRQPASGLRPSD